jgi:hypothetical protein
MKSVLSSLSRAWWGFARGDRVRGELVLDRGRSRALARRRALIWISALGAIDSLVVGLRQTGALSHLPDPPGRRWHSDAVVTSRAAYAMGVPDAPLGALAFTLVMAFAARLGGAPASRRPLARLGLLAASGAAATGAAFYLWDMLAKERRLCAYCLGTAAASFAVLPLALRETCDT